MPPAKSHQSGCAPLLEVVVPSMNASAISTGPAT